MASIIFKALRDADWLDASRARGWRNILFGTTLILALVWIVIAWRGIDPTGKALGADFISFYSASKLVLGGEASAVYEIGRHHAAQTAVFHRDLGYAAFFYPPLFLLICAPLALLPYTGALAAWLAVTGATYLLSLRAWLDRRIGWLAVLAFPGVFSNLGHGQNAFLSGALLGAGAAWMETRPILAGVAFGLLAFKPHLGLMLPLALIAAGRWRTFAAATATVLAFAGASLIAYGMEPWRGFLAGSAMARAVLEQGLVTPGKMTSLFAAVRVLGGPTALAYAAQGLLAAVVAIALALVLRRRTAAEPALVVMASLLASPFLLDYDLAILAFPLAWLAGRGLADGFRPWEKLILLAGYVLPLFSRLLAVDLHVPIAPLVMVALFVAIWRRATPAGGVSASLRVRPA